MLLFLLFDYFGGLLGVFLLFIMKCIHAGFISRVSRFFKAILFLSTNCGIEQTFTIVACFCFWTVSTDMTLIQT